jgi:hypothetical protein
MRALAALLTSLLPWLVWAQQVVEPEPVPDPTPALRWNPGLLWVILLALAFISLVAWALSRGRYRGGPPVAR